MFSKKIKSLFALLIIFWLCLAGTGIVLAQSGTLPPDPSSSCDPNTQTCANPDASCDPNTQTCANPDASGDSSGGSGTSIFFLPNLTNANSFEELVEGIAEWLRTLMIPLSAIMVLWAAVLFMTSGGSEEQVAKAKRALFWALVGVGVIIISSGLITLIKDILSVG